ncbi:hypothetical protein AB0395_25675 [Streptosporangium sp. NPDC051023]
MSAGSVLASPLADLLADVTWSQFLDMIPAPRAGKGGATPWRAARRGHR